MRILFVPDREPLGFGQFERRAFGVLIAVAFGALIGVARIGDGVDLLNWTRRVVRTQATLNDDVIVPEWCDGHQAAALSPGSRRWCRRRSGPQFSPLAPAVVRRAPEPSLP